MKLKCWMPFISVIALVACKGNSQISEINLFPVKSGEKYQYIDREGKIVINPQFEEATSFRDGVALIQSSGEKSQWGYIREDGKFVISPKFKSATIFSEGLAWVVTENGAPTAIDIKGNVKFVLNDAENVRVFTDELAAFSIENDSTGSKWGFVDKTGKIAINPQFSICGDFSEGKSAVRNKDGKWGYIDEKGKLLINYQFDDAREFLNGKAVVFLGEKAGVIDLAGKFIINPQFSNIKKDGSMFLIEQDNKWGWTDETGKITINPQFEDAYAFNGGELAAFYSGKSWGYIDREGRIVINPQFDGATPFNGKRAMVVSNNKVGFIDDEGKYVINPQFDAISPDVVFLMNGSSKYSEIETDFFNLAAIVNRIKVNLPEGLLLTSKISQVLNKLKKSESDFSEYSSEHVIFEDQKITNDASLSFYLLGRPFIQVPDGWYTKTVFNKNASIDGFAYIITLAGRGYGKEEDVIVALEKLLAGYKRISDGSSEESNVYSNGKQTVKFIAGNSTISIVISNETPNQYLNANSYYTDSIDSTAEAIIDTIEAY